MPAFSRHSVFQVVSAACIAGLAGSAIYLYWHEQLVPEQGLSVEGRKLVLNDYPGPCERDVNLVVHNKSDKKLRVVGLSFA
jgi:hypothetical protein